jgi:dynein heavy chain
MWKKNHHSWVNDPFDEIDASNVEEIVDHAFKTMGQVIRYFRDKELPGILKIAEGIKKEVEAFKPHYPVLVALKTEGMKERHWDMLSKAVKKEVRPHEGFNYKECMDMGLHEFTEECVDIGEKAGKEFAIENSLAMMKRAWDDQKLGLKPFKNTGSSTVYGFDDAIAILDEQTVLTQTMQFSPFRGPFEAEIEEWNTTLLTMMDTIDMWMKVQNAWMYLQPIFDAPDIQKQLPGENKKFKGVDKTYRAIITETEQDPNTLSTCSREGLLDKFVQSEKLLDFVKRGLMEYLESKRAQFARFYFLANEDLLEILSQTKEVRNVRPHLRKVFENLNDVEFTADNQITKMFSGEKECIPFDEAVNPHDKGVEFWMGELEDMMFKSIRSVLLRSIENYTEVPRTDWMLNHPGQCVLNGSQVHWTTEVEEAMSNNKLAEYVEFLGC